MAFGMLCMLHLIVPVCQNWFIVFHHCNAVLCGSLFFGYTCKIAVSVNYGNKKYSIAIINWALWDYTCKSIAFTDDSEASNTSPTELHIHQ